MKIRLSDPLACLILLLSTFACTPPTQDPTLQANPSSTATAIPSATSTITPSPTAEEIPARNRYNLSAVLDYNTLQVDVDEEITYVNRSTVYMNELLLVIEPLRWEGAFRLTDIRWSDGTPVSGLRLQGAWLLIPLRTALAPGKSVSLSIQFELYLPQPAGAFGNTGRQINLTDWYPFLPPYDPELGWRVHSPAYIGEHLAYDSADFHVEWTMLNAPATLSMAASSLPEEHDNVLHFDLPAARCFSLSLSEEYEVITQQAGGWTIRAYVFSEHAEAGQTAVTVASEALTLYDEIFKPYPYDSLTIVEADFFDGLETSGLFFLDQVFFDSYVEYPTGWLTTLVAHETSHQWWHTMVGNDQAVEPWLDEALATYSERLYYEHLHPDFVEWWWYRRVDIFRPQGMIDGSIYDYEDFRDYVDSVYLRGVRFLEAVRTQIGDEAFITFLQDYAQLGSDSVLNQGDFFRILTEHSDENISIIVNEFFGSSP